MQTRNTRAKKVKPKRVMMTSVRAAGSRAPQNMGIEARTTKVIVTAITFGDANMMLRRNNIQHETKMSNGKYLSNRWTKVTSLECCS